jgi:hypothetical protein
MAGYQYIARVIARPAPDAELAGKSAVFLLRHPLDVIVSLYFHIQKHALHERKLFNDWPLDLAEVPMIDFAMHSHWGLRETIDFYNGCARHAAAMPRAHILRYEDMRRDPARSFRPSCVSPAPIRRPRTRPTRQRSRPSNASGRLNETTSSSPPGCGPAIRTTPNPSRSGAPRCSAIATTFRQINVVNSKPSSTGSSIRPWATRPGRSARKLDEGAA